MINTAAEAHLSASPAVGSPSGALRASTTRTRTSCWTEGICRGSAAAVTFSPEQMKTWMDTRVYANSPWSPPFLIPEPPADGKFVVQTTFAEPGTYVLRAIASDGSLFTYENVTVDVTR